MTTIFTQNGNFFTQDYFECKQLSFCEFAQFCQKVTLRSFLSQLEISYIIKQVTEVSQRKNRPPSLHRNENNNDFSWLCQKFAQDVSLMECIELEYYYVLLGNLLYTVADVCFDINYSLLDHSNVPLCMSLQMRTLKQDICFRVNTNLLFVDFWTSKETQ